MSSIFDVVTVLVYANRLENFLKFYKLIMSIKIIVTND